MKINKAKLKQIIAEELELASLQPTVDAIYELIEKEVEKIPAEAQGIIWSSIMSKIAEKANSEEADESEIQEIS